MSLERNIASLQGRVFDLVIIGGGIHGLALAREASLSGLSVALAEKADFGSGATEGTFKTVHGGLRYLQHLDLVRLRSSVVEQRFFMTAAPHLVAPLPFLVPCYGYGGKSPEFLRLGLTIYEQLSRDRNRGVIQERKLPPHQMLSTEECMEIAPGLNRDRFRGGVVFYDCQMRNSERLTLSFAFSAAAKGAVLCNYLEVRELLFEKLNGTRRVRGVRAHDQLSGTDIEIRAKFVVNCAGPWVETLVPGRETHPPNWTFSKGVQVVLKGSVAPMAIALESGYRDRGALVARGNRSYFAIPWRGFTLLGTADILSTDHPDSYRITKEEVMKLVEDVSDIYHSPLLRYENVLYSFGGLRPVDTSVVSARSGAASEQFGSVEAARRDLIIDHQQGPLPISNFISVIGIKYTTARRLAERVVEAIKIKIKIPTIRADSLRTQLVGGEIEKLAVFTTEKKEELRGTVHPQTVERLVMEYGTLIGQLKKLIDREPELSGVADGKSGVLKAEIVNSVRNEMAVHLTDVFFRRTCLGWFGEPELDVIRGVAALMGRELGWDETCLAREIESVSARYRL